MATSKTSKNPSTKKSARSRSPLAPGKAPAPSAVAGAADIAAPDDGLSSDELVTAKAALAAFLPEALALPADAILPYRIDAALALHNVTIGVASVLPFRAVLEVELPAVPFAALTPLPDLAMALRYAAFQAEASTPEQRRGTMEAMKLMQPLRRKLLSVAEGLAENDLVPRRRVDAIRAGSGWQDGARDLLDLHDLFDQHALAIAGKHAITETMLADAQRIGTFLLANLKPRQGRATQAPAEPSAAVDARDRLHTLLHTRFAMLRKAGYYLFGDGFDARVPALQARSLGARPAKEATPQLPATPAPTGEPTPA